MVFAGYGESGTRREYAQSRTAAHGRTRPHTAARGRTRSRMTASHGQPGAYLDGIRKGGNLATTESFPCKKCCKSRDIVVDIVFSSYEQSGLFVITWLFFYVQPAIKYSEYTHMASHGYACCVECVPYST